MFSWLDAVILGSLALGAYLGYRKGLGSMVLSLVGTIAGLVAAFSFYHALAAVLIKVPVVKDNLSSFVTARLTILPQEFSAMPIKQFPLEKAKEALASNQLPPSYEGILTGFTDQIKNLPQSQGINTMGEGLTFLILDVLVKAVAFILLYLIFSIVVKQVGKYIMRTKAFAPLGRVGKIGGLAVGFLFALVNTVLTLTVFVPVISVMQAGREGGLLAVINQGITNSFVVQLILQAVGIDLS